MKVTDILKGDKITVTITNGDRKTIYTGVADHDGGSLRWRTADDYPLWTDNAFAVIELLDRPKPKIKVPTNTYAQVTYTRHGHQRFAVLTPKGMWKVYDKNGDWQDEQTLEGMDLLANENEQITDFKVLFEGVAK